MCTPASPWKKGLLKYICRVVLIQEIWGVYKHSFCIYSHLKTAQQHNCISDLGPMTLMQHGCMRLSEPGCVLFCPVGKLRHSQQPACRVGRISCLRLI